MEEEEEEEEIEEEGNHSQERQGVVGWVVEWVCGGRSHLWRTCFGWVVGRWVGEGGRREEEKADRDGWVGGWVGGRTFTVGSTETTKEDFSEERARRE